MSQLDLSRPEALALLAVRSTSDIESVLTILLDDYSAYQGACAEMIRYDMWARTIEYVEANESDLDDFLAKVRSDPAVFEMEEAQLQEIFFHVNRLLLNYLSAAKTFIDYTETYLKRHFGVSSSEATTYCKAKSAAYDRTFAYRFLIRLRNFAQHCGLPIGHIDHTASKSLPTGTVSQEIRFFFDVASLLRDFEGWSSVRAELEGMGPRILVDSQVKELSRELRALHEVADSVQRPRLETAAQTAFAVLKPAWDVHGAFTVVGQEVANGGGTRDFHWEVPPYRLLRKFGAIV